MKSTSKPSLVASRSAHVDALIGDGRAYLGPENPSAELLRRLQPGMIRTLEDVADIESLILLDLLNGNISFAKSRELREWALLLQTTAMSRQPKGKVSAFSLHAVMAEGEGQVTQPIAKPVDAFDALVDAMASTSSHRHKSAVIEHKP